MSGKPKLLATAVQQKIAEQEWEWLQEAEVKTAREVTERVQPTAEEKDQALRKLMAEELADHVAGGDERRRRAMMPRP